VRSAIRLLLMLALLVSASSLSPAGTASATPAQHSQTRTARSATDGTATARTADARTSAPPVTITDSGSLRRLKPTTVGEATFTYAAVNVPGVLFQCKLNGPKQRGRWNQACPLTAATPEAVAGAITFRRLTAAPKPYTFTVQTYIPAVKDATGKVLTPRVEGRPASFTWYVYSLMVRDHYVPQTGVHFNYPLGSKSQVRTNLRHVIRTIDSMPGFLQPYRTKAPCRAVSVSRIRISLYSLTDDPVAQALIAAAKRCVSVQVLMNNHLSSATDPAWHHLVSKLKGNVFSRRTPRPSFAHRCSFGCQGSGVLHTKMYLFDSEVPAPRQALNKIVDTVMTGSSNMTQNAAKVQWNDLYTVRDNPGLYATFGAQFDRMKRDNGFHRTPPVTNGNYQTIFSPSLRGPDPYLTALRTISCTGAHGAGIGGHTAININMHAWFGSRGLAIAHQVRSLYNQGCHVRILYGFMSFGVYRILHAGTGGRMSVRRTVFSHNGLTAYLYSHFKNIAVSGNVAGVPNARVSWTGSNNFTNDGTHFDEVILRINSASTYNAYIKHFDFMRDRASSSIYANFSEPSGGGRAPRAIAGTPSGDAWPGQSELDSPPGTPTITAPGITVDANGEPHAAD
jgi:phosphatidylserine/phosphatidylglycerophosphate/cardiolipin synthase-like enzyme